MATYRKCWRIVSKNGGHAIEVRSLKTGKRSSYLDASGRRVKSHAKAMAYPSRRIAQAAAKGAGLTKGCPI